MKTAFEKSWIETRRQNKLVNRLIIESEKPKRRIGRDPLAFGSAGFKPRRAKLWRI